MCEPAQNGNVSTTKDLAGLFRKRTRLFSSLATNHSSLHFLIAGEKILKTELTPSVPSPNAFLIAGDFPPFSPAATPRISNRYTKLLEIELTRSQQTRKHFLIGTICPTFSSPAPRFTHHLSLVTHRCLTSFLFDTNGTHKIVAPLKTKEKQVSIRYKFALRGTGLPAEGGQSCLCAILQTPRTPAQQRNFKAHSRALSCAPVRPQCIANSKAPFPNQQACAPVPSGGESPLP